MVDRTKDARHAGVTDAIQMAARQVLDGTIQSDRIIIILDQEDTSDVHLFLAGIDMWDGLAMMEVAKHKIMYEEGE